MSSTEKNNTKVDLARAMTKSKSKMQTVTNGCGSHEATNRVSDKHPNIGDLRVSRMEVQSPQGDIQEGKRLMIIELERYNKIRELLIENRATGLQGHICYQDGSQRVSVTMAAVHMGVKELGM